MLTAVEFLKTIKAQTTHRNERVKTLLSKGYTEVTSQTYMKGTGSYGNKSFSTELRKQGYSVINVGLRVFSKKSNNQL